MLLDLWKRQREQPDEEHNASDRVARERARAEEQQRDDRDAHRDGDDCWKRKHGIRR